MRYSATLKLIVTALAFVAVSGELLQNGGFESMSHWDCWNIHCYMTGDKHSGNHAMKASGRNHYWEGPSQYIQVTPGHSYQVSGWMKVLNNAGGHDNLQIEIDFTFPDNTHQYVGAATSPHSNNWVHLIGAFTAPSRTIKSTRVYFQGPGPNIEFIADDASVTEMGSSGGSSSGSHGTSNTNSVIDRLRKSNINIHVNVPGGVNNNDYTIQVLQTKKSFPFGTAVNAWKYNDNVAGGRYRDFIHKHFNWAVHEASLKWPAIEPNRGEKHYDTPMALIHAMRSHGIKVRAHNLVWSVDQFVQGWVKALSGNDLRNAVRQHITETMGKVQGLVEHWDVNNENLHGWFYQNRLNDPSYNVEIFREAHQTDPNVKLFLNDYNVVANWGSTHEYLKQAQQFKTANVGLYGIGAQCHFGNEEDPDANGIKQRLDLLAQAGVPIWVTELDVQAQDENRRADFYEHALRALYGHPSVEGILFWGFWDQAHWRGDKAALVKGNNLDLTAAGRRVLDLLENQWMTEDSRQLSHTGNSFVVRGFHGDYEVHVYKGGHEVTDLKQTFTLAKDADKTITINLHS